MRVRLTVMVSCQCRSGGFWVRAALMGVSAAAKPTLTRRSPRRRGERGDEGANADPSAPRTVTLIGGRRIRVARAASNEARIRLIADGQRGRVSRCQLLKAGVEPCAIKRRLRNGRLELVHRGVYGQPGTADLPLAPEIATLLACGDGAELSHHSAAVLWRLRPGTARPVHVTIAGDRGCPAPKGVKVHRSVT